MSILDFHFLKSMLSYQRAGHFELSKAKSYLSRYLDFNNDFPFIGQFRNFTKFFRLQLLFD